MTSRLEQFIKTFSWVENSNTPWAPMVRPLDQSKLAVISTGGIYVEGDAPFLITAREDVDQSYREIPLDVDNTSLRIAHEHYNKGYAEQDMNVVFPVERLKKLVSRGFLGELAETNFSITGYIPQPDGVYESGKKIAQRLREMKVDAALVVPV